jgi:probable rRNA maturation factor
MARISLQNLQDDMDVEERELVRLGEFVLGRLSETGSVSLVLAGTPAIVELNGRFFQKPLPTDVIAFPLEADEVPGDDLIGEVVVCPAQVLDQALEYGVDAEEELMRVVVHGLLHIHGRLDDTSDSRRAMLDEGEDLLGLFLKENH